MKKLLWVGTLSVALISMLAINSCKRDATDSIMEPITIVKPDSLNVNYVVAGQDQPINIQFTTDRPLIYVKCLYEVDSSKSANHVYSYPDTLFYSVLDSDVSKYSNKFTYTGTYHVPDTLQAYDKIRFQVSMKAGHNPSSGNGTTTVSYQKEFLLNLR